MRCPKCGQQNQEGIQYCYNCGNRLEVMQGRPLQGGGGQVPPQGMGRQMPGGQGGPVRNIPQQGMGGQMPPQGIGRPPQGMGGTTPPPRRVSPSTMEWQSAQGRNVNVPPNMRQGRNDQVAGGRPRKKKKNNNTALIATAGILGALLLVVAIVLILSVSGVFNKKDDPSSGAESGEVATGGKGKPREPGEEKEEEQPVASDEALDGMIEPVDQSVDEARETCDESDINEMDDGLSKLSEAIASYIEIGNQCGDKSKVEDKVYSTYDLYMTYSDDSIASCKSLMNGCLGEQPGQGYGEYFELMSEFYSGQIGVASYMQDEGYTASPDQIETDFRADRTEYISRLIERFNEFTRLTSSKTWSRTECWTLMESVDPTVMLLVENEDDATSDPLVLRYSWAAAYNKQKTAETNVSSGEWTAKHAADSIRDGLQDTLYCPFLVQEYVMYASRAGINCQAQMAALKQCEQLLLAEQRLDVNKVKDGWKLVWFFNDFGECTSNGVDTTVNIVDYENNGIRRDVREKIIGILASSFEQ